MAAENERSETSASEERFLYRLYEKIISGEIRSFEALKEAVSRYKLSNDLRKCVFRAFTLQKKLYWGFFSELNPKEYQGLWRELVIPDTVYRFAGDLKRSMSIPEIYFGLLDIHGYTKYCNDKKRNMSMIDLLDRMIYEDVNAICRESGVLSRRAQGDEILLLGASARTVLRTTLEIMDYFNTQGRSFRNTVLSRKLPGTVLPKFQISAGIAGGQKFTPLVITRDGDLSGDIVNTAARLQSMANKLSPDFNRIMITSHVYQKFQSARKNNPDPFFERIDFFDTGSVEFKGVSLNVYDIVFLPGQEGRLKLLPLLEKLYGSLDGRMWKTRVLTDALDLAVGLMKPFLVDGCEDTAAGRRISEKCRELIEMNKSARTMFNAGYYNASIDTFSLMVDELSVLPGIDAIAMQYLQLVKLNYNLINDAYTCSLDREVELSMNDLFNSSDREKYLILQKQRITFDKIQASTRLKLKNRKKIWLKTSDELEDKLFTNIQSLK